MKDGVQEGWIHEFNNPRLFMTGVFVIYPVSLKTRKIFGRETAAGMVASGGGRENFLGFSG
jgi:hypothetical protein